MQLESLKSVCPCSSACKCTCCRYLGNIGHDPLRSDNQNEMDDRAERISERMDRIQREH